MLAHLVRTIKIFTRDCNKCVYLRVYAMFATNVIASLYPMFATQAQQLQPWRAYLCCIWKQTFYGLAGCEEVAG